MDSITVFIAALALDLWARRATKCAGFTHSWLVSKVEGGRLALSLTSSGWDLFMFCTTSTKSRRKNVIVWPPNNQGGNVSEVIGTKVRKRAQDWSYWYTSYWYESIVPAAQQVWTIPIEESTLQILYMDPGSKHVSTLVVGKSLKARDVPCQTHCFSWMFCVKVIQQSIWADDECHSKDKSLTG